jgi:hypothetical protein
MESGFSEFLIFISPRSCATLRSKLFFPVRGRNPNTATPPPPRFIEKIKIKKKEVYHILITKNSSSILNTLDSRV